MNPTNPNFKIEEGDAEVGAKKLGLETVTLTARNASEMETALQQLLGAKAHALITGSDPILLDRREQIASFALQHNVLAMGVVQQIAAAGGLLRAMVRASVGCTDKQATTTAKALGFDVPPTLLARLMR
jgi:putative ABC transport system substrate-binding protein